jgi:hypothetical protein
MEMPSKTRAYLAKGFKKLIFAVAMTFLFLLLGLFGNIGYSSDWSNKTVTSNKEYRNVELSITYNPILYPFYWITGNGHISLTVNPSRNAPQSSSEPHLFDPHLIEKGSQNVVVTPFRSFAEICEEIVIAMLIWGIYGNLFVLLTITIAIEILRLRVLYIILFSGIIGFFIAEIIGTIISLLIGIILATIYMLKLPKNNMFVRYWSSLWK